MRVCTLRETELRVNPTVIIVPLWALIAGEAWTLVCSVIALTLHECAHALTARQQGIRISVLTIYPMGAVMDMVGRDITPSMECRTAAAGPIVSVTACALSFAFGCLVPRCLELLKPFIYANAIIAAVNLLPCFPLDGGRMCECLLLRFLPPKTAAKICIYMGLALGAILAAVGVFFTVYGLFMPVLYMLAGFILTAAIKEIIHLPEKQVSALLTRRSAVKHGKSVAMKLSIAHGAMRCDEALRCLCGSDYHILRVVDDRMQRLGELDENAVLDGIARYGSNLSLGELLDKGSKS